MKEVVAISANSLGIFQGCPTAYNYSHELKLAPFESDENMDKGSLGHSMIAHYYTLLKEGKITDFGSIQDEVEEFGRIGN
jgi:hypothetical protein